MSFYADPVFSPDPAPLSVAILLLDETSLMVVAATIDPMRAANRFAGRSLFSWTVATPNGEPARLTSGSSFPAQVAFRDMPKADVLIVLAGFNHHVHADAALIRYLSRIAPRFRALGSVDSGGWVLARAGLLDGRTVTVHPEDAEAFAFTFPAVSLSTERQVIGNDRFSASGGLPAFDLMMTLIARRYGSMLSAQVQGAFVRDDAPASLPENLIPALQAMTRNPEEPLKMAALARLTGQSRRSFEAQFRRHLGTSPAQYALSQRLQIAARLVQDTALGIAEIAVRTGFSSQSAFSRAFSRRFGQSPRQTRATRGTLLADRQKKK